MSKIKVRFAPSPTGNLHVGNLRTALVNYLFARRADGHFMLRIDDTDTERSTDAFETDIRADLEWMGMGWDCEAIVRERFLRPLAPHVLEHALHAPQRPNTQWRGQ